MWLLFLKQHDAVCICSSLIVGDSPAPGGFGECMRVDENSNRHKAGGFAASDDMFFQVEASPTDFSHFDCGMSTGCEAPSDFSKCSREHLFPSADRSAAMGNNIRLDPCEPAPEPIVSAVVDHI